MQPNKYFFSYSSKSCIKLFTLKSLTSLILMSINLRLQMTCRKQKPVKASKLLCHYSCRHWLLSSVNMAKCNRILMDIFLSWSNIDYLACCSFRMGIFPVCFKSDYNLVSSVYVFICVNCPWVVCKFAALISC